MATVPQAMPDELFATTPPSVQAPSLAGSGPSLRPCGGEAGVDLPDRGARADAHAGAVVEHLDAAEVAAGVGEDPAGDRLPGQAGAARAERERHARAPLAAANSLPTSAASRGTTTACGVSTKCEASWA